MRSVRAAVNGSPRGPAASSGGSTPAAATGCASAHRSSCPGSPSQVSGCTPRRASGGGGGQGPGQADVLGRLGGFGCDARRRSTPGRRLPGTRAPPRRGPALRPGPRPGARAWPRRPARPRRRRSPSARGPPAACTACSVSPASATRSLACELACPAGRRAAATGDRSSRQGRVDPLIPDGRLKRRAPPPPSPIPIPWPCRGFGARRGVSGFPVRPPRGGAYPGWQSIGPGSQSQLACIVCSCHAGNLALPGHLREQQRPLRRSERSEATS
jgi:hypothetical protein